MINLYEMYNSKRNKFGVADNSRFRASFLEAVNLAYADLNAEVFRANTLQRIENFDDIIDSRLTAFTDINTSASAQAAISDRSEFTIEMWLARTKTAINGLTYTFGTNSLTITNNVIAFSNATTTGSGTMDISGSPFKLSFKCDEDGHAVYVDDVQLELTYSVGDASDILSTNTVSTDEIDGVSGFELIRWRWLTGDGVIYDFLLDEETVATNITDEINGFTATISGQVWNTIYIEPSTSLSDDWRAVLNMALDYHLQDGGEWALEPEENRYTKWYTKGIRQARTIYQYENAYTGPLGEL